MKEFHGMIILIILFFKKNFSKDNKLTENNLCHLN